MTSFARIAVLTLLACLAAAGCGRAPEQRAGDAAAGEATAEESPSFTEEINQIDVTLYFLRSDGEALAPETRRIFRTATVVDRARQALQALFDGPDGDLIASVPPGTRLMEIFLAPDGTAYVDLGPEFRHGIGAGSSDAVYAIYAIVNTLAVNFPEIRRVKLLIDGDEAGDVGDHFDFSRPILPEMAFVDEGAPLAPGGEREDGPAGAGVLAAPPAQAGAGASIR